MKLVVALFLSLVFSFQSFAAEDHGPLRTVEKVDLTKYAGLWYEVARFPNWFEKGCEKVTAQYSLKKSRVKVLNSCQKKKKNGKYKNKVSRGTALVVNKETNATLKVSFVPLFQRFGWFGGDYNVLALGDSYEYALVGSRDRNFLWILSRTKELPTETIEMLKIEAETQGFDTERFYFTPQ